MEIWVPAIDVFPPNHSMAFLPERPPHSVSHASNIPTILPISQPDLALDHDLASQGRHVSMMPYFVFRCPTTSMNVQHWSDEDDDVREHEYEGIICPACTRLHFLNRRTGKLLGQEREA